MALLDFLKRKSAKSRHLGGLASISPKASLGGKEKLAKKNEPVSVSKEQVEKPDKSAPRILTGRNFSYEAVKEPHISEKASYLAEKNQYIFQVSPNYNKQEIKKSIEGIYGVDVLSVNIVKIPAKKRRIGKTEGFRKGFIKAIVKIKEGQKIEIL